MTEILSGEMTDGCDKGDIYIRVEGWSSRYIFLCISVYYPVVLALLC